MDHNLLVPGNVTNTTRLIGWLSSVVDIALPGREDFEIRLTHLGDEAERVVRVFRARHDMDAEDIAEMVRTIEQVASDDTEHMPGAHQRYTVAAVTHRGDPLGSLLMKVTARFRPASLAAEIEDRRRRA